jgi:hypothetical protein
MVLPDIRLTEIDFAIVFLTSDLGRDHLSLAGEADHIVRAGIHTDTTAGAELGLDIEVDGLAVTDCINLILGCRIDGIQFERINRTCGDTVATTGTPLHVYMYRKRHAYHTLVVVIFIVVQQVS